MASRGGVGQNGAPPEPKQETNDAVRSCKPKTESRPAGTLAYVIHQRRDDPLSIVVYEKYASDEAFAEHGKNLGAKAGEFMSLMDGPPEVILIEEI